MRTSGLLGAGGGGAAGAGAGAAGWAELGSGSAVGEGGGGEDESGGGLGSATEGRLIYIGWDISLSLYTEHHMVHMRLTLTDLYTTRVPHGIP